MLPFFIPCIRVEIGSDAPLQYEGSIPSDFSVPNAMKSLYGNFDPSAKVSVATLPTTGAKSSYFDAGQKINVRPFWVIGAKDSDTSKIYLLTFATPDAKSFGCH